MILIIEIKKFFFSLFFCAFLNYNGFRNNNNYGVYIGADYGHYELTNVVASTDTRRNTKSIGQISLA